MPACAGMTKLGDAIQLQLPAALTPKTSDNGRKHQIAANLGYGDEQQENRQRFAHQAGGERQWIADDGHPTGQQ